MSLATVNEESKAVVNEFQYQIDFTLATEDFDKQQAIKEIFSRLEQQLVSSYVARNLLRRTLNGIYKESDVRIPTKDGNYVLADVLRPLKAGTYPVVMCMGAFGKSSICGSICNEEEFQLHEQAEDAFFESYGQAETKTFLQNLFFRRMGPCFGSLMPAPRLPETERSPKPDGPPPFLVPVSEFFEQPNSLDWVPYGYVVILVEERGTGANIGDLKQFGAQNAEDFCSAIEWAAQKEWSNGNVGLWGASYYAMTQYLAAQRKPKGLKAMIPIMGDCDSYRDYIYSGGGLYNRADNMNLTISPQKKCFIDAALENPFYDPSVYGPEGEFISSCDIGKIDLPIWVAVEPGASLHGRGSSEAYINSPSKHKKLLIVNEVGIHFWMYGPEIIKSFRDFFDHWLKGIDNDIMNSPAVSMQIRTGSGGFYWRHESDWPVPGTKYTKFYLDTQPNDLKRGARTTEMSLTIDRPVKASSKTYNADVLRTELESSSGVVFVTNPLEEDLEIAGYIKACLWVSSNTKDMEVHISVSVLDENNMPVSYSPATSLCRYLPLGFGALKVSHRKKDLNKSSEYRPVYTHLEEDYQPLIKDEIVECEVGTFPTTGLIRKGWRLRLAIEPLGNIWIAPDEEEYRPGSQNTIFTGATYPSYLQLPVLPKKK